MIRVNHAMATPIKKLHWASDNVAIGEGRVKRPLPHKQRSVNSRPVGIESIPTGLELTPTGIESTVVVCRVLFEMLCRANATRYLINISMKMFMVFSSYNITRKINWNYY